VLTQLGTHLADVVAPSTYVGSSALDTYMPGLSVANGLNLSKPVFTRVISNRGFGRI